MAWLEAEAEKGPSRDLLKGSGKHFASRTASLGSIWGINVFTSLLQHLT